MSLTLYKGPACLDLDAIDDSNSMGAFIKAYMAGDVLVNMDQTDTMLRFDILRRLNDTAPWELLEAYVFTLTERADGTKRVNMSFGSAEPVSENSDKFHMVYRQFAKEHHDYLSHILGTILDTSAHKVVKKHILRFFRQASRVDSFEFISDPDTVTLHMIYPQLKQFMWNRYYNLSDNKTLERSLRQNTVEGMTKAFFGKRYYRKDLVKAVAQIDRLEMLIFIATLKNNVPIDWIINILRKNPEVQGNVDRFNPDQIVEFYNTITPKQFRKLCMCLAAEDSLDLNMLTDIARLYLEDKDEEGAYLDRIKFRSIGEFHHALLQIHGAIEKERARKAKFSRYMVDLPETKVTAKLREVVWEGAPYDVVFPKQAIEIYEWGTAPVMNNCIGSYALNMMTDDATALFALYQEGEPFVNIEANLVDSYYRHIDNPDEISISQFQGKKNSRVKDRIVQDFSLRLVLAGLVTDYDSLPYYANLRDIPPYNSIKDILNAFEESDLSINQFIERTINA